MGVGNIFIGTIILILAIGIITVLKERYF